MLCRSAAQRQPQVVHCPCVSCPAAPTLPHHNEVGGGVAISDGVQHFIRALHLADLSAAHLAQIVGCRRGGEERGGARGAVRLVRQSGRKAADQGRYTCAAAPQQRVERGKSAAGSLLPSCSPMRSLNTTSRVAKMLQNRRSPTRLANMKGMLRPRENSTSRISRP